MTAFPLTVVTNPPAVVVAGSAEDYGVISLDKLTHAIDLASEAFRTVDELKETPDSLKSLRADLNRLSDALRTVGAEIYQVGIAVRTGRITVTGPGAE